ncbi:hypothetical protein QFC20_003261 [Naganishia adeliensis]|uniref:Uncharacterized protein n=1 Tax=Naganishia adeliensis TaxID=92952 RepID=A0ACC2WG47_9TREE|nr:hypothetical protein QFC20_003261 [Naganishia adeliensis]
MRADQENGSIDEGADGKTTPPYQSKGNTPTSIRQITKRLGEETFEHGIFKGKSLSLAKKVREESPGGPFPVRASYVSCYRPMYEEQIPEVWVHLLPLMRSFMRPI